MLLYHRDTSNVVDSSVKLVRSAANTASEVRLRKKTNGRISSQILFMHHILSFVKPRDGTNKPLYSATEPPKV